MSGHGVSYSPPIATRVAYLLDAGFVEVGQLVFLRLGVEGKGVAQAELVDDLG